VLRHGLLAYERPDIKEARDTIYIYVKDDNGRWLCAIDNSYGIELLQITPCNFFHKSSISHDLYFGFLLQSRSWLYILTGYNIMMTYEYDAVASVIHLRASGVLKAADPIKYFKEINTDQSFKPKAEERIYFTGLDDIEFKFTDVIAIKDAFEFYEHGEKISHGVFIVDSDLSLGMANMVINLFADAFDKFTIERIS